MADKHYHIVQGKKGVFVSEALDMGTASQAARWTKPPFRVVESAKPSKCKYCLEIAGMASSKPRSA